MSESIPRAERLLVLTSYLLGGWRTIEEIAERAGSSQRSAYRYLTAIGRHLPLRRRDGCYRLGSVPASERPRKRGCSVDGCDRKHGARGLCRAHYARWRAEGASFERSPIRSVPPSDGPCECRGCDRERVARGLCRSHYRRWRKHGDDFDRGPIRRPTPHRPCECLGCPNPVRARGLCATHYQRWRQHGDGFDRGPIRKQRRKSQEDPS